MQTQMYPYPPYIQDFGMSQFYGSALPTFVVLSFVLLSPSLIKSIVYEKETGVRVSSSSVFTLFPYCLLIFSKLLPLVCFFL